MPNALVGFPQYIKVTLGSAWTGNRPDPGNVLAEDYVAVLKQIGATDVWSENGTDVANPLSNRLRFTPVIQASYYGFVTATNVS